jgi:hypothetical protein
LGHKKLCEYLGYTKESRTRVVPDFTKEIYRYFEGYESQGNKIPAYSKVDTTAAEACAHSFLLEEDRGERLFQPDEEGYPVWPKDKDLSATSS